MSLVIGIFIVLSIYFYIKNFLPCKKLAEKKGIKFDVLKYTFFSISLPITNAFLCLFTVIIYRVVSLLLKLKLGNSYGGMLKGRDLLWAAHYPRHLVMSSMFLVESDLSPEDFYKNARELISTRMKQKLGNNIKVNGIMECHMGYACMIKNVLEIDQCIGDLKTTKTYPKPMDKEEVTKLMELYSNDDLPYNNTSLWQVLIGRQAVLWKDNMNDAKDHVYYPIVWRMSHVFTDGVHFLKGIMSLFNNSSPQERSEERMDSEITSNFDGLNNTIWNIYSKLLILKQTVFFFFDLVPYVTVNMELIDKFCNPFHGSKLNNKMYMSIGNAASGKYLQTMKNAKNAFPGVRIMDIFMGILGASFTDYFEKYETNVPENMVCMVAFSNEARNLGNTEKVKEKTLACTNKLQCVMMGIPMLQKLESKDVALKNAIYKISEQHPAIENCKEAEIYSLFAKIMLQHAPLPIISKFSNKTTTVFTNIPQIPVLDTGKGMKLKKILVFGTNRDKQNGIICSATSYDNVLNFTFSVNSALIEKREQVQEIVDGLYKYLDILDSFISSKNDYKNINNGK